MKYCQYKGVVERDFNMSLKKVMHQLVVVENLNAAEGAKKMGIAKEIFVYWRNHFRLEKRQMLFDQTVEELKGLQSIVDKEIERGSRSLVVQAEDSQSLDVEKKDSMKKHQKPAHYTSRAHSMKKAKLPLYKYSKSLVTNYKADEVSKELQSKH